MGAARAGVDLGAQGATVRLHREALGRSQRWLLPRLAPLARQHGFYLAGGTALALQLGHRRSVDFASRGARCTAARAAFGCRSSSTATRC